MRKKLIHIVEFAFIAGIALLIMSFPVGNVVGILGAISLILIGTIIDSILTKWRVNY